MRSFIKYMLTNIPKNTFLSTKQIKRKGLKVRNIPVCVCKQFKNYKLFFRDTGLI